MDIDSYKLKIKEVGFEEYPYFIGHNPLALGDFIEFDETTIELKIYLIELILCRCFSPTGGTAWPQNPDWFIQNFLGEYQKDFMKPWLTTAIKEGIDMVMSDEHFTKGVIATTFMFGIIEFYAKYKLGFRPNQYDFFDSNKKSYFKKLYPKPKNAPAELSLGKALELLQKENIPLADSLKKIDAHNAKRMEDFGIAEQRYTKVTISKRLSLYRNAMAHGESHAFYSEGKYLVMLYILFYYHDVKELALVKETAEIKNP